MPRFLAESDQEVGPLCRATILLQGDDELSRGTLSELVAMVKNFWMTPV